MKKLILFLNSAFLILPCFAQGLTNTNAIAASRAVMVNTNGVLAAPLDFFAKNSNALNAAVSTSALTATNINATNFIGGTFTGTQAGPGTNTATTNVLGVVAVTNGGTGNTMGSIPVAQVYGAGNLAAYFNNLRVADWSTTNVFSTTWLAGNSWTLAGVATNGGGQVIATTGNPQGGNYPMFIGTNDTGRMLGSFSIPAGSFAGCYVMMGVSVDASGAAPAAGGGNLYGFGLVNGATTPVKWTFTGGSTSGSLTFAASTTYNVCMGIDTNNFSFVVMPLDHSKEYRYMAGRSAVPSQINNFGFWLGDARQAGGILWNQIGGRNNSTTITPRNSVEGRTDFVQWTQDDYGQNIRIWQPAAYDSKTNIGNLILYFHGNGNDENYTFDNIGDANITAYFQTLVNSNFTIIASACHGTSGTWGSPNSVLDGEHALQWYRNHYAYSNLFVMGGSAGGATALNFIAAHLEKVSGGLLDFPVANLDNMWAAGYTNEIGTAFGAGASAGKPQYAGYNPITNASSLYYGVPIRIYASPTDGTVSKAANADALIVKLGGTVNASVTNAAYSPELSEIATTGAHGDDSNFTNAVGDVAFFQRCLTYALNNQGVSLPSAALAGTQWPPNVVTTNGAGQTIAQSLTLTSNLVLNAAPTFSRTNAAPSNVTIGTTVADLWLTVTNGGSSYFIPIWKNH